MWPGWDKHTEWCLKLELFHTTAALMCCCCCGSLCIYHHQHVVCSVYYPGQYNMSVRLIVKAFKANHRFLWTSMTIFSLIVSAQKENVMHIEYKGIFLSFTSFPLVKFRLISMVLWESWYQASAGDRHTTDQYHHHWRSNKTTVDDAMPNTTIQQPPIVQNLKDNIQRSIAAITHSCFRINTHHFKSKTPCLLLSVFAHQVENVCLWLLK